MEVKMDKNRLRKAVRAQERRIFGRVSYPRTEMRNRNRCYSVGKWDRGRGPLLLRLLPTLSKEVKERFPRPTQSQAILPGHIVWVEHQLHHLPGKSFHIAMYSREGPGVWEFYAMVMVEPILSHCQFVWMSKPYVHMVLFYSGLCRSTTPSDVHLTTLAGYAVNPWIPQS
jgi:hypothetical protein